jgi:hypothetical protein
MDTGAGVPAVTKVDGTKSSNELIARALSANKKERKTPEMGPACFLGGIDRINFFLFQPGTQCPCYFTSRKSRFLSVTPKKASQSRQGFRF